MDDTIFSVWWWLDAASITLVVLWHIVLLVFIAQIGAQTAESARKGAQAVELLREIAEKAKSIASKGRRVI